MSYNLARFDDLLPRVLFLGGPVLLTSLCDFTPAVDAPDGSGGKMAPLICQTDRLDVVCEGHRFVQPNECLVVTNAPSTRDG